MNEAEYIFKSDIKEKKACLSGARGMKKGSKSKKCTLPSDYLTPSQKKKLNGEVKTYKMHDPIKWEDFKEMPTEHQENYIVYMVDTYHVTAVQLGEMMGISSKTLGNLLREKGLNEYLPGRGHKMTKAEKDIWDKFLNDHATAGKVNVSVSKRDTSYYQRAMDEVISPVSDAYKNTEPKQESSISRFSIGYEGDIKLNDVYNYLRSMLGENFNGHLDISFTR